MDYPTTLKYLDEVQALGIKLGLQSMAALLEAMGEPQKTFPAVVVAGTNGKGSVSAMLASILTAGGRRAGLYTSPHLVRYEERIVVAGAPIDAEDLAAAVTAVRQRIDALLGRGGLASHPTHFEVLTAAAFHHFRQRGVSAAALEVGMGGRLDAVALARAPVAVITNVSLEHTRYLGDTVAAIAAEKAGIIREGCGTVITGEQDPEALAVIREAARAHGARLVESHRDASVRREDSGPEGCFDLSTPGGEYLGLKVPLAGRHQIDNAVLAVLAAEVMRDAIDPEAGLQAAVRDGLARTVWPGRLQAVGRDPLFLLDGAHNPAGCRALAAELRQLIARAPGRRVVLVFGVLEDKDVASMMAGLFPVAARVILTRGASERFCDPERMAEMARGQGFGSEVEPTLSGAIGAARAWAKPGDAICLCGSLYLVGDAMAALGLAPDR